MRALQLYPLLYTQGLWVASRALRLPEPAGPRSGRLGEGPPLRLLILGDSSAAGVGVAHQDQALSGHLSRRLARDHRVDWTLQAKSGATSASTLATMDALEGRFDAALIALGVNDAKNGVRQKNWTRNMAAILTRLREDHACPLICVSALPEIDQFPLLPNPLRRALALRARRFDAVLRQVIDAQPGAVYLPALMDNLSRHMAEDGFHPGEPVYAEWARLAEALMRAQGLGASNRQSA